MREEFKGTPGPWFLIEDHSHDDDNGNGPTFFAISTYEDDTADAIAWIGDGAGTDVERANSNLIAASLDLLEALIPFAHFACDAPHINEPKCQNCKARDAIAKALGRSQ